MTGGALNSPAGMWTQAGQLVEHKTLIQSTNSTSKVLIWPLTLEDPFVRDHSNKESLLIWKMQNKRRVNVGSELSEAN